MLKTIRLDKNLLKIIPLIQKYLVAICILLLMCVQI